MHDSELHRFKTDIDLVQYAGDRYGYQRDRRESSRASHVLRHAATKDKIIVRKGPTAIGRTSPSATIAITARSSTSSRRAADNPSLGPVREELRQWLGAARSPPEYGVRPAPAGPDRRAIEQVFLAASRADHSPYLHARGIRPETLRHPRFAGRWGVGARGNALFVHTTEPVTSPASRSRARASRGLRPEARRARGKARCRPQTARLW
jgi:hypothetical protein